MTRAPQAIPDEDEIPMPSTPNSPASAPEPEAAPRKRRGRPPGSGARKPRAAAAPSGEFLYPPLPGEAIVRLQILSTTKQHQHDFDREASLKTDDVRGSVSKQLQDWFRTWVDNAIAPRAS